MLKIKIKAISKQFLPNYQTLLAAGMDLMAAIDEPISILPGERKLVGTGISIALPPGFEAQIRSRSGIAFKNGVCVLNSPGTIDADYRGEIKVLLINHGQEPFLIHTGDRIAQMIIAKHERIEWETVIELDETERGIGGYGSTGIQNSN
jgi:dUTP pyrophosphatase